jgi:RHS repeat-associated protein
MNARISDGNGFKYEYGPFGEVFCSVGDMAKVNPFGFSTKYTDTETDLVYYGYRYYSPALGRWLSRDPIEERGGLNLYGFVNNDPVNKWDKLGKQMGLPIPNSGQIARSFLSWTPPWTGCCGGKSYNRITHCCRKNTIFHRLESIPTNSDKEKRVRVCYAGAHSHKKVDHMWLEGPFGSIDVVADDDIFGSIGRIGEASDYVNKDKICSDMFIFPCSCDVESFLDKLEEKVNYWKGPGKNSWYYVAGTSDCRHFVPHIILSARWEAGCGDISLGQEYVVPAKE